jgi:hypothetical protein
MSILVRCFFTPNEDRTMNNLIRAGIAGLTLAAGGAALADDKPGHAEFGSVDQNRDGRVSKVEAQAHAELTSQFATLDADRDSYLSQTEFGKWKAVSPGAPPPSTSPESGKAPGPAGTSPPSPEPRSPGVTPQAGADAPQSGADASSPSDQAR